MNSLTLLNEHAVDIALADRIDYYNPKVCRSTFDIDQQCRLIAVLINGLIQLWRVDNVNSPVLLITVPADELSSCLSMDPNATNEPVNGIAGMHYLPDSEQLIMVLLSGDLLQIWPAESKVF
jgi:hypothetical protein